MQENTDQKISKYRHFLRNAVLLFLQSANTNLSKKTKLTKRLAKKLQKDKTAIFTVIFAQPDNTRTQTFAMKNTKCQF